MARVVLVGLPGVGKSTLAAWLATSLGCVAIDTDDALATIVGCPAPEYWRRAGEVAFRAAERVALRNALEGDAVVATGGGVVSSAEARELLRHERTLWLDCDDDVLMERLVDGDRPLVADEARTTLERLRSEREPWYRDVAFARIDASGTPSDVNALIREALAEVRG